MPDDNVNADAPKTVLSALQSITIDNGGASDAYARAATDPSMTPEKQAALDEWMNNDPVNAAQLALNKLIAVFS
jgi:hypothetical protein